MTSVTVGHSVFNPTNTPPPGRRRRPPPSCPPSPYPPYHPPSCTMPLLMKMSVRMVTRRPRRCCSASSLLDLFADRQSVDQQQVPLVRQQLQRHAEHLDMDGSTVVRTVHGSEQSEHGVSTGSIRIQHGAGIHQHGFSTGSVHISAPSISAHGVSTGSACYQHRVSTFIM